MTQTHRPMFLLPMFLLPMCLLLAACGGGAPSTADADAALRVEFERALGGAARVDDVRGLQLSGCRKAESTDGYACDVSGEVVVDIAGTKQARPLKGNFRFNEIDGQWAVHEN